MCDPARDTTPGYNEVSNTRKIASRSTARLTESQLACDSGLNSVALRENFDAETEAGKLSENQFIFVRKIVSRIVSRVKFLGAKRDEIR